MVWCPGLYGDSQVVLVVKNLPTNAGDIKDVGSIPGLGRSPGGGPGNPLLYSCLENPRTEEPGGLQCIGSRRVEHDWRDLAGKLGFQIMWREWYSWQCGCKSIVGRPVGSTWGASCYSADCCAGQHSSWHGLLILCPPSWRSSRERHCFCHLDLESTSPPEILTLQGVCFKSSQLCVVYLLGFGW